MQLYCTDVIFCSRISINYYEYVLVVYLMGVCSGVEFHWVYKDMNVCPDLKNQNLLCISFCVL